MKRREFVISSAAGLSLSTRRARTQPQAPIPLERVAIMTYSFNDLIGTGGPGGDSSPRLALEDVPEMFADRYGVHNIEVQHSHFLSTELDYLETFRARAERSGSRITQINLEFATNMSSPEPFRRLEAVELTKRWIDHAVTLNCPRVMLNQGNLAPEIRPAAIDALRTMGRYGDSRNVWVTLENRGQAGWELVAEVVKAAETYTTPDLGNFPDQEEQLKGIRGLLPMHGGNCHVKLRPERYDLGVALALTRELGYDGLYSIEATRNVSSDPYQAVSMVLEVLLANL